MILQVGEGDAGPRPLQQCLVVVVAVQGRWRGQLGLVEHDKIWLLFLDQPAQVPLLLVRVDALTFHMSNDRSSLVTLRLSLF